MVTVKEAAIQEIKWLATVRTVCGLEQGRRRMSVHFLSNVFIGNAPYAIFSKYTVQVNGQSFFLCVFYLLQLKSN